MRTVVLETVERPGCPAFRRTASVWDLPFGFTVTFDHLTRRTRIGRAS